MKSEENCSGHCPSLTSGALLIKISSRLFNSIHLLVISVLGGSFSWDAILSFEVRLLLVMWFATHRFEPKSRRVSELKSRPSRLPSVPSSQTRTRLPHRNIFLDGTFRYWCVYGLLRQKRPSNTTNICKSTRPQFFNLRPATNLFGIERSLLFTPSSYSKTQPKRSSLLSPFKRWVFCLIWCSAFTNTIGSNSVDCSLVDCGWGPHWWMRPILRISQETAKSWQILLPNCWIGDSEVASAKTVSGHPPVLSKRIFLHKNCDNS